MCNYFHMFPYTKRA